MPKKIAALAAALLACCWALPVAAQDAGAQFYRGKTVTIVVGSTAGGGYDTYARLLGRYLGKHIAGEPTVIVSDMPGAGGDTTAAYVANVASKDGTYIAAPTSTVPLDPVLHEVQSFDARRANYLGTPNSDVYLCVVRSGAPATTFDDMFKTQVIIGGAAADGTSGYLPIMLSNVLGVKFKVVFGYTGSREMTMAIEKAEVDGMCGLSFNSLKSQYEDLLKNGEIKIVAQENEKGLPELNKKGVPLTVSYVHDEQQRRILEIIYSQEKFAHPYFVPAEVPADRLQMLRRAFMETLRDPDLLADAAKMNLDVDPMSGEEVQSLVQKIYASPPSLLQSVREAIKRK
jgi:tripartite-type tricarboxylate transporter receptor subunit TctC